jgi:hypothetical protein
MDVDGNLLTLLGISAALIPSLGSIVKTTVDVFRGAFELETKHCIIMNYCLSLLLVALFLLLTLESVATLSVTPLSVTIFIAQIWVTAWLTGNWAAMQTDVHNRARQNQQLERHDEIEETVVVPDVPKEDFTGPPEARMFPKKDLR